MLFWFWIDIIQSTVEQTIVDVQRVGDFIDRCCRLEVKLQLFDLEYSENNRENKIGP